MSDAVTIVVVHISRQQGQSLLNIRQHFGLKARSDLAEGVNQPGHIPDAACR